VSLRHSWSPLVVAEQEPGGAVNLGSLVELGPALPKGWGVQQAGECGCFTPAWCLSQWGSTPLVPQGAGDRQGLMGGVGFHLSHAWLRLSRACSVVGSGGGAGQSAVGPVPGWGLVQSGGGDPSGRGSGGMTEGPLFWCCVGLWAGGQQGWEMGIPPCVGLAHSCGLAQLCGPTGRGFGRLAVLLLDHGVVKPSTI
jgi:hypothetical protein